MPRYAACIPSAAVLPPTETRPEVVYEREPGAAQAPLPPAYRLPPTAYATPSPRPALYRIVACHLETLLAEPLAHRAAPCPRLVESEFRRFLTCSVPAYGFYRVRCPARGHERLLELS